MSSSSCACPVLVVDDDDAIRDSLSMLLEDEGYPVATASNGQEALDYLQSGPRPCLILLDLKMPVMNGQEFRSAQQLDADISAIPVAVISAHVTTQVRAEVEADAFLPKPVDIDALLETVERYCSL